MSFSFLPQYLWHVFKVFKWLLSSLFAVINEGAHLIPSVYAPISPLPINK